MKPIRALRSAGSASTRSAACLPLLALALAIPHCGSAAPSPSPAAPAVPASAAVSGSPPPLVHARLETPAGGLTAALREAGKSREPVWVGYSVPMVAGQGRMCCFTDKDLKKGEEPEDRDAFCRLEERDHGWGSRGDERREEQDLHILVRFADGVVSQIRGYSADCRIDAGGRRFVWLNAVEPRESLDFLTTLIRGKGEGKEERRAGEAALAAVAQHRDGGADALLESLAGGTGADRLREPALFWMGQTRGERGARYLERFLRNTAEDRRLREHAIFSLSQSRVPWAQSSIAATAREDADGHLRSQALFWLAQMKGGDAKATILAAIANDHDREVRRQAVFALTQLQDGGVPVLLQLVRESQDRDVKEQALFWLAQSKDPQALSYLDKVLND